MDLETLEHIRQTLTGIEILLMLGLFSLIMLIGAMGWDMLAELRGMREENEKYQFEFLRIERTRNEQGAQLSSILISLVQHMEWKEDTDESI